MPTITGCPAETCAAIHAALGLWLTTVVCPGMLSAELKSAPRPLNQPACEATVAGVTERRPKCEYTIARSESRQPICHTGNDAAPTPCDAQRESRWLKYAPHASPLGWGSRTRRSVLP